MEKPLKPGYYYLLPTWEFRFAQTEGEAQKQNPIKIWKIETHKEYHLALEEAGKIQMDTEKTFISKIKLVL